MMFSGILSPKILSRVRSTAIDRNDTCISSIADEICQKYAIQKAFESSWSSSSQQRTRSRYEQKKRRIESEQTNTSNSNKNQLNPDMDHYDRLDLPHDASNEDVKSSFYKLSKKYHPDIAGQDNLESIKMFQLIKQSYEVLSDPIQKNEYDKKRFKYGDYQTTVEQYSYEQNSSDFQNLKDRKKAAFQDAGRLFRMRQESAMERDKKIRPDRYRAGQFKFNEDEFLNKPATFDRSELEAKLIRYSQLSREVSKPHAEKDKFYQHHRDQEIERRIDMIKTILNACR